GAVVMATGLYWFSTMNLQVSPGQLVWPRGVQMIGTSALFPALSVATFLYLPKEWRGPAAGIFAALGNEGCSAGTTLGKELGTRRAPLHTERLVEGLNPFNVTFNDAAQALQAGFYHLTGDPVGSQRMAYYAIDQVRLQQAALMAYLDSFWLFAVGAL